MAEEQKINSIPENFSTLGKKISAFGYLGKIKHPLLTGFVIAGLFSIILYGFAAPPATPYDPGETSDPGCTPGSANCTVYAPVTYTGATNDVNLGVHNITASTGTFSNISVSTGGSFSALQVAGYVFPTSTGAAGQFLATDASGTLSWSTPAATGLYAGLTTSVATGGLSFGGDTGYAAGDNMCNADWPGSHMCAATEILHTIAVNVSLLATSGLAWVNAGAQGVASDCVGHSPLALDTDSGSIWEFDNTGTGGKPSLSPCSPGATNLACCQ